MKIGILTLPLHINYGGILQAWALQTLLERMGHKIEVFGIKPESSYSNYALPLVWLVRLIRKIKGQNDVSIFYEIKKKRSQNRRFADIRRFVSEKINTKVIPGLNAIPENYYDAIVVGSDQIWRKEYINSLWRSSNTEEAFLSTFNSRHTERIAYAASFGINSWSFTKSETIKIREALSRFRAISVREISAVDLLESTTRTSAKFVLDPTMLLTPEDYIECLRICKESGNNKLVSYILDPNEETAKLISKIAATRNLENKEINLLHSSDKLLSIENWVESIANAEMVVTDSFHGCVFSIIFNKPLIFIVNESRGNARFASLITTFGIQQNCLENPTEYNSDKKYNLPNDIQSRLERLRSQSISWLTESLKQKHSK